MPTGEAPRTLARSAIARLARTRLGVRLLAALMHDEATLNRVITTLSDEIARESLIDERMPAHLDRISCFEDCAWLLTPNLLEHGASRLMLDEAAYLFRLVRSLDSPQAVELGRYHGGTTLLLAAAGAEVLTIDIDQGLAESDDRLRTVLARLGLQQRVRIELADSKTYSVEDVSADLVLVDADHTLAGASADLEHWWRALRPGGHLILHDGKVPSPSRPWNRAWKTEGVLQAAAGWRSRDDVLERDAPGTIVHYVRLALPQSDRADGHELDATLARRVRPPATPAAGMPPAPR